MKQKAVFLTWISLLSITLTVVFASVSHYFESGYRAFTAGAGIIAVLFLLMTAFWRFKNKAVVLIYGLLSALIIIGFGLANGFWNHGFKVFLIYLHGGAMPPVLSRLFMNPQAGSFAIETIGILTFTVSMIAAYFTYQAIRIIYQEDDHEER